MYDTEAEYSMPMPAMNAKLIAEIATLKTDIVRLEAEIQELIKRDRMKDKQVAEDDDTYLINQKGEHIKQLQKENEIIVEKNKVLMDMLFIQMGERSSSSLEKLLLKDRTVQTDLYEQNMQKVEQLRAPIREFGVVHKHLEDAKETELDTHRTFFEIKGIINKVREETGQKKWHTLQLKEVLGKEIETWGK